MEKIRCNLCGQRLFDVDDKNKAVVYIKLQGTKLMEYNLRDINNKIKEGCYKVKSGKKYFFDVIKSKDNIIKIKCSICKKFYLINLDKGICREIKDVKAVIA